MLQKIIRLKENANLAGANQFSFDRRDANVPTGGGGGVLVHYQGADSELCSSSATVVGYDLVV